MKMMNQDKLKKQFIQKCWIKTNLPTNQFENVGKRQTS